MIDYSETVSECFRNYFKYFEFLFIMLVFSLLSSISAYILAPKHSLMITRTTTMPYTLSGIPQQRPYMEPVFIHRITREEKPEIMNFAINSDKKKEDHSQDPIPGYRRKFTNMFFNNSLVSIAFLSVSCMLFLLHWISN
ncbi:hypothetical protein NBO_508g0014 [Nosema bombycis CQ1]|uniref:Uncharacterized protein n=1 Tax=Nosema bombycis (strain CQ1 / CVCC 102059) TaxID=578461 RepID=R0MH91_NOSB1|nr:hypothetical protein NBO_508g0014 [Nosema bombycis CQ1]|eukprot:EOB12163.1 hypothetical protein NBO_508g0014 [Nosema bombycis CQ1]